MSVRNLSQRVNRVLLCAFSLTVLGLAFSDDAAAQTRNKKTSVTFSGPVEIPGADAQVLPAGTYVFRLLDSQSDRHIVQIFSGDESRVYATILAIPNHRLRATDKTVVTFAERPAGEPQAIRAWFYPGDNWGQEFVYPRKRAVALAKLANQPVLYIPDALAVNIVAPVKTATEAAVVALKEVPLSAVRPTGDDIAVTEVVEAPPVQLAGLPRTASGVPLLALMGLLSMGLGFSLKALCAR